MTMGEQKLCCDCKHARKLSLLQRFIQGSEPKWFCYGPHRPRSLVDGSIMPSPCLRQREDVSHLSIAKKTCGPKGEFFEPREEQALIHFHIG